MIEYSFGYCVQFVDEEVPEPQRVELQRQEEREHERADPEQPADGALDEAEDEPPEQVQDDDDVEDVDLRQGVGEIHTIPR